MTLSRTREPDPPDEELIHRFVAASDHEAFGALAVRHRAAIRRILTGMLAGSAADVDDAEQEVLVALYRGLARFRFGSRFTTYLYRIVHNKGVDALREARSRSRLLPLAAARGLPSEVSPEHQIVRREQRGRALRILAALPERDRALVLLREVEGLKIREIARVMGTRVGTVKSRLHRIRARIERLIDEKET